MKKIIALILTLCLLLSVLCACGETEKTTEPETTVATEAPTETETPTEESTEATEEPMVRKDKWALYAPVVEEILENQSAYPMFRVYAKLVDVDGDGIDELFLLCPEDTDTVETLFLTVCDVENGEVVRRIDHMGMAFAAGGKSGERMGLCELGGKTCFWTEYCQGDIPSWETITIFDIETWEPCCVAVKTVLDPGFSNITYAIDGLDVTEDEYETLRALHGDGWNYGYEGGPDGEIPSDYIDLDTLQQLIAG